MKGIILIGDKTSGGGTVLSASEKRKVQGKGIGRIGDSVSCSLHGENSIAEGDPSVKDEGKSVAFHGHRLICGCTLITSTPNIGKQ